jgi:cardiolipin synthase
MHDKVLIIDHHTVIIGGINIGKIFIDPPWLDYAVRIQGSLACEAMSKTQRHYKKYFDFDRHLLLKNTHSYQSETQFLINDWTKNKKEIYREYLKAVNHAQSEIIFVASYFVPGKRFLRKLKKKAKQGVKVTLILSQKSDLPFDKGARRFLYTWFYKHGIEVYEWHKTLLHAKMAIIDQSWCSLGSYNFNFLSHYGNSEANIETTNIEFIEPLYQEVQNIKKECIKIVPSKFTFIDNLRAALSFLVVNIVSLVYIFWVSKDNE